MNKPFEKNSSGANSMDEFGRIIEIVGARETVPPERLERSRHKVRTHWQKVVAEQRQAEGPRRFKPVAIAAGLLLVAGTTFMFWNLSRVVEAEPLARVERVLGDVQIQDGFVQENNAIDANTSIVTGDNGRIALRLSGGQSLRIDTSSRVVLQSPNHVSLTNGAIYIDTATAAGEAPVLVSTPLGTAHDTGTQFQVRVTGRLMVVGVRTGQVEVTQAGQQNLAVDNGFSVELHANGESGQSPLRPDDPDWAWIETIAPEFDIEGATLEQYLQWYAQERGLELTWADAASEARAKSALLAGSIAGLSLDEGLALVKQVAPFEHRISGDGLWVKVE